MYEEKLTKEDYMHTIEIAGDITTDTVATVREGLKAAASGPVTLRINSEGGGVGPGSTILQMLKDYTGQLTARIEGSADSMASLIAASCDHVSVTPDSSMLIHRAAGPVHGTVHDHIKRAENLLATDKRVAKIYAAKSGRPAEFWEGMMDKEVTLRGKQIVDYGLADETALPEKPAPPAPKPETSPQPQGERVPLAALWGESQPKTNTGILFIF